jgi:hypothetical protein
MGVDQWPDKKFIVEFNVSSTESGTNTLVSQFHNPVTGEVVHVSPRWAGKATNTSTDIASGSVLGPARQAIS